MDKLKLTGQNLGRVVYCRLGRACIGHAIVHTSKQPNFMLKTQPKQLLGSLPLAFALPGQSFKDPFDEISVLFFVSLYLHLHIFTGS
jgi:hypothetical protein